LKRYLAGAAIYSGHAVVADEEAVADLEVHGCGGHEAIALIDHHLAGEFTWPPLR